MPRRSRINPRKTGVRSYFRRLAAYGVEEIDLFRELVKQAQRSERRKLLARNLSDEATEFVADEIAQIDSLGELADQLSIVALHRVVELNIGRMLAHRFGKKANRKAGNIDKLQEFLKRELSLDVTKVPHYRSANELRLLNNAVKHSGEVTHKLAEKYPRWEEGQPLSKLGDAYDRLSPKVPKYVLRLAEGMKLRHR
jgi:predicted house-cleaning noncanonical NTP pyrophosphatase (MazG superfamily)